MNYKIYEQESDPINNQINNVKQAEIMISDLDSLSRKYNRYRDDSSHQKTLQEKNIRYDSRYGKYDVLDRIQAQYRAQHPIDPYEELIESKNLEICDLKKEISDLKQKLVDTSLSYNSKIERLRQDHRRELHIQHKKIMEKLKMREQNSEYDKIDK
jgi:hypothetical protein